MGIGKFINGGEYDEVRREGKREGYQNGYEDGFKAGDREARLKNEEMLNKIFEISNNAIYFRDNSDYLPALHQICRVIKPDDETIGEVCI